MSTPRYSYSPHPMINAVWSIPLSANVPITFEGFLNYITEKGKNEFGSEGAKKCATFLRH